LTVTFGVETNVSIDQVNVQNRVAQAQPNLPAMSTRMVHDAQVHRLSHTRH